MKKILLSLLLLAVMGTVDAQDPNFSQFFTSPLTLNPALTGKFDGDYRLAGNYRNQWPTINNAFTTATFSADFHLLSDRLPDYDQFGIGIMGFTDKSGNGVLQHNYLALSTAYHKALDEDGLHQLGLGFQGTYVSKHLDVASLKLEDMLRSDGFTGLSSENFQNFNLNLSYFDVNAGVLYNGSTNGNNNFYLGASGYHLNKHEETFSDKGFYYLPMRLTIMGGGMVPAGDLNAFHFSFNYSRQANATNTVLGGAYMMNLNGDDISPVTFTQAPGTALRMH